MVASLDENIGRVLTALPENTLVAFTSDNGPAKMPVEKWPDGWPKGMLNGSAGPLNGHKGQFLDVGIREPFLLRWPGKLKPGSVFGQSVSTMDLHPTFCAAAGARVPAGTQLDGVNLLPFTPCLVNQTARSSESRYRACGQQGTMYNSNMTTQELLIDEIRRQPEPVQREVLRFLRFLVRERDEESWADVLPGREVEHEVLSILDGQGPQTR
jgi:arylsulfatase A-like enzyme